MGNKKSHSLKVDFGGVGRDGEWLTFNCDAGAVRPRPDVVCDITASSAQLDIHLQRESVDVIRCVHTLEHLPARDIHATLMYWREFLKPCGALVLVVPDMGQLAHDYCAGHIPMDVVSAVGYVPASRVHNPAEEHRWGWDHDMLYRDLMMAGYVDIRAGTDDDWVSHWTLDFSDVLHTGCVGKYQVRNLRMRGYK